MKFKLTNFKSALKLTISNMFKFANFIKSCFEIYVMCIICNIHLYIITNIPFNNANLNKELVKTLIPRIALIHNKKSNIPTKLSL